MRVSLNVVSEPTWLPSFSVNEIFNKGKPGNRFVKMRI